MSLLIVLDLIILFLIPFVQRGFCSVFFVAEYKDVWKIERKLTNTKEVKANIYKERTMVELNNEVIEKLSARSYNYEAV